MLRTDPPRYACPPVEAPAPAPQASVPLPMDAGSAEIRALWTDTSYACRRGKGTHQALDQFTRWGRSNRYVLKMDIRKFFPSMDHEIPKAQLSRVIRDPDVLRLCDLIIDGSNEQEPVRDYFPGDNLFTPLLCVHGIPIGNLTSQFFGNVYLDALDHFVKERLRVKRYLRYVDDFCCFDDDKERLTEVRAAVQEYLGTLRMKLNEGKSRTRRLKEGVEFLGFVHLPETTRLNQRAVRRQRGRMKTLQEGYRAGLRTWDEVTASLQSWNAHAASGDTWWLRRDVFRATVFSSPEGSGTRSLQ